LLMNGPEQCASARQPTASAPTRAIPPQHLPLSCRPIPIPAGRARLSPGRDRPLSGHIADGSRQEWGWVPHHAQQKPEALQTGYAFPQTAMPGVRGPLTRALKAPSRKESVGDRRHERMTVKSVPGSALEVIKTEFFFQLLVSLLANPSRLDDA